MIKSITTIKNKIRRRLDAYTIGRQTLDQNKQLGIRVRHPDHLHTFCGYYDRSPFSPDGKFLLLCCVDAERLDDPLQPAHIYTYELASGGFTLVASTLCWNFQQSAQQQWLGNDQILFNSENAGQPVVKIHKLTQQSKFVEEIQGSAGVVNRKRGLVALYDYGPMSTYEHDYGYKALSSRRDYKNGRDHLKITIWSLADRRPILTLEPGILDEIDRDDPGSRDGIRYIQHVKFNQAGTRILFVLRSAHASRIVPFSSLHACELESGKVTSLIPTKAWIKGCNHPVWANDDEVLINLFDDSYKARKFQLINTSNAGRKIIAAGYDGVGHPTICDKDRFILTDQYMRNGFQGLIMFPLPSGRRRVLAQFPPAKYPKGADRCDLHPRYDAHLHLAAIDHYDGDGRVISLIKM